MSENKQLPVGMSAGGDNAHIVHCEIVEHQKLYTVCLHLQRLFDGLTREQADSHLYSECFNAMRRGKCIAAEMREEELQEGQALYYRPRKEVTIPITSINKNNSGYASGWNRAGQIIGKKSDLPVLPTQYSQRPAPKKEKAVPIKAVGNSFADAINEEIKETKAKTTPVKRKVVASGRSLLDIARGK